MKIDQFGCRRLSLARRLTRGITLTKPRRLNFASMVGAVLLSLASGTAMAGVNCNTGSGLADTARDLLGYQQGAESWDDINIALGIIPDAAISENVRSVTESADDILGKLKELQELCQLIADKDPVEQYFYAVNKLFSKQPMAGWVSLNVQMAKSIVRDANNIAANSVANAIDRSSAAGVHFAIELSQYGWAWNRAIVGKELKAGNHLRLARLLIRNKITGLSTKWVLGPSFECGFVPGECNYPLVTDLFDGSTLIDGGIDINSNHLFLDLLWKNGQRTVVPVARGYYNTANLQVKFPFMIKNGSYVLNK